MLTNIDGRMLLDRHERAVRLSVEAVQSVTGSPLDSRTPCVGWDLRTLLDHMAAQNRGFAAAARGEDDPAVWDVHPTHDPFADVRHSADEVLASFADPGALTRTLAVPEVPPGRFPAQIALCFHLIDSVVHAWDVARTVGRTIELDADLAHTALRIAEAVPTGSYRQQPGAAFAAALEVPPESATMDRILLLLGRSPHWRPS